jgi:hypothetical protein
MRYGTAIFAALLFLLGPASGQQMPSDIPAFPDGPDTRPNDAQGEYSLDTPIETLAADPAAAAIINTYIPGLLEDGSYPLFKGMSLKLVASFSRGRITDETLGQIESEFEALPVKKPGASD